MLLNFDKGSGLDHPSGLGTRLRASNFISPVGAVNQSTFRTLHIREKKALLQLCQRGSSLQLCRALCRARVSRHADYRYIKGLMSKPRVVAKLIVFVGVTRTNF